LQDLRESGARCLDAAAIVDHMVRDANLVSQRLLGADARQGAVA
jgi:hypothetical protein